MEPKGSLLHLQAPTTCQINPIHVSPYLFMKIHFNIILPFMWHHLRAQNIQ